MPVKQNRGLLHLGMEAAKCKSASRGVQINVLVGMN